MSSPASKERIREVEIALEPVLAALDVDLEQVEISSAGRRSKVRVIVDADGGIDLDGIAALSQAISGAFDDANVAGSALDAVTSGGPYTLEVSSRGVDRPLTKARHWRRNIGRLVEVHTKGDETVTGRIESVDESPGRESVTLSIEAGSRAPASDRRIDLDEVQRATVQVEFRRASADSRSAANDVGDNHDTTQ